MVQILKQPAFGERLGEALGTGLGGGLSSGLENLAKIRLQNMAQERLRTHLSKGLQGAGYNPEIADQLSYLGEDLLKPILTQRSKSGIATSSKGLKELIPELSQQQAESIATLTPGIQLEFYRNWLNAPEGEKRNIINSATSIAEQMPFSKLQQPTQVEPQIQKQITNPKIQSQIAQQAIKPEAEPVQPIKQVENVESKLPLPKTEQPKTLAERVKEGKKLAVAKKELAEERKEQAREQRESDKETLPAYKEILKGAKNARESEKLLDRVDKLIEKGYFGVGPLLNAPIRAITKGIFGHGIDLSGLLTADAQELEKLTATFVRGAKDFFPGRITNVDLQAWMAQIPSLAQTKAGMKRAIYSLRAANKAALLRENAAEQIIKNNGGKRPNDFELQIERLIGSDLDKLAEQFLNAPFVEETGPLAGILYY